MTIKFKESLAGTGYEQYEGKTVENAETIFGPAQAAYFLETGTAEAVGEKKKTATAPQGETPEK
ncbi:hypothetical protein [Fibrisoma montanum]|nr:hypothetical protein [Fibrisoma montanum]